MIWKIIKQRKNKKSERAIRPMAHSCGKMAGSYTQERNGTGRGADDYDYCLPEGSGEEDHLPPGCT